VTETLETQDEWVRGDWMQTFTGIQFYPLTARPEEIDSADIAHALSLICRYGGHVDRFYSVAEHCVLMSYAVRPENALAALLHDAAEAYMGDVIRPLKRDMPRYKEAEHELLHVIGLRYDYEDLCTKSFPAEVTEADNRILLTERDALMKPPPHPWHQDSLDPLPVTITGWDPLFAEMKYLTRLKELTEDE
jgi:uncharacterized protein